ncbi:hypothetical protein NZK32_13610 [Cyanobium sp. FGCU-52]|nr:hypothetical protein [Cyanobium sp. FGCU52]
MSEIAGEICGHAAASQGPAFNFLPATVLAALITQICISVREACTKRDRQKASLAAVDHEFEEICTSLHTFWGQVQDAWDETDKDAVVRFCTLPYPEGSMAAWFSSLRTLLPILAPEQTKEKIGWLYAAETLIMLRKKLADDYERFCVYERSKDTSDGEVAHEMAMVQSAWITTQLPRLIEYKKTFERLQFMRNQMLSKECGSI